VTEPKRPGDALHRPLTQLARGGTSLLDNTLLMYTSYMADGGHGRHNYPVLPAGKAGGTLKTGRHVAHNKDTPATNLYVEILARMGDTSGKFGNSHTSPTQAYDGRLVKRSSLSNKGNRSNYST